MILITSVLGFCEDWSMNALLCPLRDYLYNLGIASIYYFKLVHQIFLIIWFEINEKSNLLDKWPLK